MLLFVLFCLVPEIVTADNGVFDIRYPSVVVAAQSEGNVSLQSGATTHDLYLLPGPTTGTVYFEGEDLLHVLEIARSLPPVWHHHVGFFGTFTGDEKVNVKFEAEDPEGGAIRFELVAGDLPKGIHLNGDTGFIQGVVPDVTNTYSFTIRAIDTHNKYADAVFKMQIIEFDHCSSSPCHYGGHCTDTHGWFVCNCTAPYGGERCEYVCSSHAVNVRYRSDIPDAQMSAYLTYSSSYSASNGRYGAGGYGWCGSNQNSWLQVDIGNMTKIYKVSTQGYSSSYYTTTYTLSYSIDGNTFESVKDSDGNVHSFSASRTSSLSTYNLPVPTEARFIRFHPKSYYSRPCLKVELYGCQLKN